MTVSRDDWGVPHVVAGSLPELAREQGRVTAHDRGRQIELDRLHGVGRVAEVLGRTAVEWDVLARRACLDDLARRAFEGLDDETQEFVSAYVDGVRDGLGDDTLPGEWHDWTPLTIFAVQHLLFSTFPTKLWRAFVVERMGPAAVDAFHSEHVTSGSNAWAAGGGRTASGLPLVAGDPHRLLESPNVYQQIRLTCGEIDVVGFTFPGVPGVQHFAHTGSVAWGITNAMADYQDLVHEQLRRTAGGVEAWTPDGWEPTESRVETVQVAVGDPVEVEVVVSARGPVVTGGVDGGALSLRTPAWELGDLGFGALLPLLRARSVDDVDTALDAWVEPVNDALIADVSGAVRYRLAGRVPVRSPEARVRPVSVSDWDGWVGPLRRDVGPDEVVVIANDRRGPESDQVGHEFASSARARRLHALLDGRTDLSARDAAAFHTDAALATPLVDLFCSTGASDLVERLRAWDGRMDADSKGAAVLGAARDALVDVLIAHPALAPIADPPLDLFTPWFDLRGRVLLSLDRWVLEGAPFGIDLAAAAAEALQLVATGPEPVTWGDRHVWRPAGAPEVRLGGDTDCVLSTSAFAGGDQVLRGPVARYAWDLAGRTSSGWVVPLGTHGAPDHPHHHDQLAAWVAGDLLPAEGDA